jgi:hypothetical protein
MSDYRYKYNLYKSGLASFKDYAFKLGTLFQNSNNETYGTETDIKTAEVPEIWFQFYPYSSKYATFTVFTDISADVYVKMAEYSSEGVLLNNSAAIQLNNNEIVISLIAGSEQYLQVSFYSDEYGMQPVENVRYYMTFVRFA